MKANILTIVILFLGLVVNTYATAQIPDKIIYNGKTYSLHNNPMENYFEKNPDKKPKSGLISSALWRGYVATFEVAGKEILLNDIQIEESVDDGDDSFQTRWTSVLNDVVPKGQKLKIDWLNGILVLPYGEVVNYVHMGYASTYENYILLEVKEGSVGRSRELTNKEYEEFRERQFKAFKKTQEYKDLLAKMKNDGRDDEKFNEEFIKIFIISYLSEFLD